MILNVVNNDYRLQIILLGQVPTLAGFLLEYVVTMATDHPSSAINRHQSPRFSPKVQAVGGRVAPGALPSPRLSSLAAAGHLRPPAMGGRLKRSMYDERKGEALGHGEVG